MSRAIKDHLNRLQGWVFQTRTRLERVISGTGTPGSRAAPTQAGNNDAKIGVRLDYGDTFVEDGKKYRRVNLQVNKGADNQTLRAMANKNSHEVWSHADILVEDERPEPKPVIAGGSASEAVEPVEPEGSIARDLKKEKAEKMFEDLETNLKG